MVSAEVTVVHLSDLHFHALPRRPREWASKRALGALNLLIGRGRRHPLSRLRSLVARVRALDWDHLVITGDLVQLALESEFAMAEEVLGPLLAAGPERVTIVPGNHDRYVAEPAAVAGYDARFGRFFGEQPICTKALGGGWWLAGWDSARPRGPLDASGEVSPETLAATENWLAGLPADARVIVANHYPVQLPEGYRQAAHHQLRERETILAWLLAHDVRLYLHGHVHRNWVLQTPRPPGRAAAAVPLTLVNSAASARIPRPGERSSFHRLRLRGDDFVVEPLALD